MQRVFALTPTQARLAALLVGGRSVKEIAPMLAITEGTARQYLKRIFRKDRRQRRADLIRLASRALNGRT